MSGRFPFIVIEGLDGAGKTTLRRSLFRLWQGLYDVTPLCILPINFLDREAVPAIIEGKYRPNLNSHRAYVDALRLDQAASISGLVSPSLKDRPVIADRWLLTHMAFLKVKHDQPYEQTYYDLTVAAALTPDATVILDIEPSVCELRLARRQPRYVRDDWDRPNIQSAVHRIYKDVISRPQDFPSLGEVIAVDADFDAATVLYETWSALARLGLTPDRPSPVSLEVRHSLEVV